MLKLKLYGSEEAVKQTIMFEAFIIGLLIFECFVKSITCLMKSGKAFKKEIISLKLRTYA